MDWGVPLCQSRPQPRLTLGRTLAIHRCNLRITSPSGHMACPVDRRVEWRCLRWVASWLGLAIGGGTCPRLLCRRWRPTEPCRTPAGLRSYLRLARPAHSEAKLCEGSDKPSSTEYYLVGCGCSLHILIAALYAHRSLSWPRVGHRGLAKGGPEHPLWSPAYRSDRC
ncbi:uncharacterized protein BO80DRAFT_251378 [Aspergillus ibericus CBS 121593]|uniref:Uncharacterized protein n=1 Tax=Aspergillus ibericus CBS 121593 TaxID=1448316 RepID=A0A395GKC0_9EURO|nr:hypothetical protein BO80DRAFT_251378 [Aspergillus ibericus CBS 121593]RAK95686.1 hypothetical protein BO80DRAFT_251378 [Aspergillus ibericus CBS 121593]